MARRRPDTYPRGAALQPAITVERLAGITLVLRFTVTTHQTTLSLLRAKAADHDGHISTLVQTRTLWSPDA